MGLLEMDTRIPTTKIEVAAFLRELAEDLDWVLSSSIIDWNATNDTMEAEDILIQHRERLKDLAWDIENEGLTTIKK